MNSELKTLFHELVELSPAERQRILNSRQIHADLRAEVESLLSFGSDGVDGLTGLIAGAASDLLHAINPADPTHCGPYRLLRPLGSGGMGVVYLAERADGEIQQTVAIKLLRHTHRPQWRDRFLRERQLLASLQHPSIVHVVDAGHTPDGRPYLAMEFVEGIPIDAYCASVAVNRRIKLFVRVCDGVAHAHRRLIIHRDLKPSNILVTPAGAPKLLDFGIARLLDETGDATQTAERLLTPNYASPEQLMGSAQSTATDIYSLGAVLYKLLTGSPPFGGVPLGVRSELPPASERNPDVPRDVDFILRKALRPEPEDRYRSVDELAADLRSVLTWRPVQARSGDIWYRTRRYLRRFWVPVTAGAVVLSSLTAGVYIANRERVIAEARFRDVRQLAGKLFDVDREVAQLPGGAKARQLIVDTALEYLTHLSTGVRMDPSLALEVGTAYMRVARVQGVGISINLGQTTKSDETEQKAQALIDSVLSAEPTNRLALLRAAQIAHDRMTLAGDLDRDDDALRFARKAAASLRAYLRAGRPTDREEAQQAIITGINVADRYRLAGDRTEALQLARDTIALAQATHWQPQAGAASMIVALSHREGGNLDEALRAVREAVRLLTPAPGESRNGRLMPYALALIREGQILGETEGISLSRPAEAEEPLLHAYRLTSEIARHDPKDFFSRHRAFLAETTLASIVGPAQPARALLLYDDATSLYEDMPASTGVHREKAAALAASVEPLLRLGRRDEARRRLSTAFRLLKELKIYPAQQIGLGSVPVVALRALSAYESTDGNLQRAAAIYQELLNRVLAAHPKVETNLPDAVDLSNLYREAAPLLCRAGLRQEASALVARRAALWQAWDRRLPNNPFVHRQLHSLNTR